MISSVSIAILAAQLACAANIDFLDGRDGKLHQVKAGEEVTLKIQNATELGVAYQGSSYRTTHLQIHLFSYVYAYSMCKLAFSLWLRDIWTYTYVGHLTDYFPAENGTVKVTIPSDVGPSGTYYDIAAYGYYIPDDETPAEQVATGTSSEIFFLSGGEGHWVPEEAEESLRLHGLSNIDHAEIPCESYSCVQACAEQEFPDSHNVWVNGSTWVDCISECDGVRIRWDNVAVKNRYLDDSADRTIDVPSSLPTPNGTCSVGDLETPCGTDCCSGPEYCLHYSTCINMLLNVQPLPLTNQSDVASPTTTVVVTEALELPRPTDELQDESGAGRIEVAVLSVVVAVGMSWLSL
jgi:hypothetical protein